MLTYFVGDIHGCYREYLELEFLIRNHAHEQGQRSFIVSVGDLIDRGPDSANVVTHFLNGERQGSHTAIMGNHEMMMLQIIHYFSPSHFQNAPCTWPAGFASLQDLHALGGTWVGDNNLENYAEITRQMWLNQGGRETMESLEQNPDDVSSWQLPIHWLSYLLQLPLYWEDSGVVVTHALTDTQSLNILRLSEQKHLPMYKTFREQYQEANKQSLWNRTLPSKRIDQQREHISGHTPVKKIAHYKQHHARQIDTGCVYGQSLTAYCLSLDHTISVSAQRAYAKI